MGGVHLAGHDGRAGLDGGQAFVLRTMVVHEWRRARLVDPDLPAAVLPPVWPAPEAWELAASLHHRLAARSQGWLAAVTGLEMAPALAAGRFA